MFTNFLLIAVRSLLRYRIFTGLNILGLALGISCALYIFLIVKFELSYDTFHKDVERIYRINAGGPKSTAEDMDTGSPHALAAYLRQDFPEIEQVGIAFKLNPEYSQIEANNELTRVGELYYVDPGFLKIFTIGWRQGDPGTLLHRPNEAAVSETIAQRFFRGDAMGKTIRLNGGTEFVITGVFEDQPFNSDFPFEVMLSHKTFELDKNGYFPTKLYAGWNSYYQTYVKLREGANADELVPKFRKMVEKYEGRETAEKHLAFAPLALRDIHFKNGNFNNRTISRKAIDVLSLIGVAIIIIACINFTNLATAQAVRRAKEVGIRKTLGSSRKKLIFQFLLETFSVTAAALLLSILVVGQVASFSEVLIEIPVSPEGLFHGETILFMVGLVALVTCLAGLYPAFVISGFRPIAALKNASFSMGAHGLTVRKTLIAFQFMVSQALIIGTFVVFMQVQYFESKPLGFDKDNVLTTDLPYANKSKLSTLRSALLQYPEIKNISFSLNTPSATINKWWDSFEHPHFAGEKKSTELKIVDSVYISMFGIRGVAGQLKFPHDSSEHIIVNEAFINECGIQDPALAIGEEVTMWGKKVRIIGVVENFQTVTLHEGYHPVVLTPSNRILQKMSIKIDGEHSREAIAHLEKHWKQTFPGYYFTYAFLDDSLRTFYQEDRKTSRLLGMFSFAAISIGCMGLLGLVMYVTVQRTKEVGIRKILGATLANIIALLTKDFVVLVVIASACAWPISYYLMNQWLQEFANPIRLNEYLWVFVLSGLVSLTLAVLIVGSQALRSATANPASSLRAE
jgi:putative ABC transport system permease protein